MENQHTSHAIYAYLDRIGNLISAQEWVLSKRYDLQPVQLRMLYYLSICNQYSNTPSGVTEYMQLTKGTVSQSLKVLEYKGYIEKQIDAHDRRQIHLLATESGQEVLKQLPPNLLRTVAEELGEAASAETVFILRRLLVAMQRDNRMQGFGVCRTCHYHQALDERYFRCGLTGERLTNQNAGLICREHLEPHTGQRS
ncbi:MAG: winged helix-turn-helix transcriptional regulator [Caldilineaceae bacterium]|nr:winged helix-turn-helix transcriptional regulator [Caldilineaceae bacterium]